MLGIGHLCFCSESHAFCRDEYKASSRQWLRHYWAILLLFSRPHAIRPQDSDIMIMHQQRRPQCQQPAL